MSTIVKRTGMTVGVGLCVLGLALSEAQAQLNVGQGIDLGGGLGGGGAAPAKANAGFGIAPLAQANGGVNPFQNLVNNPFGGPAATMTSQAYQPPQNPYSSNWYNPYNQYQDPYSGYLQGAAAVITAQSQSLLNTQQAMQMYEQYRRSRLVTRRAALEEWLWERANTPTKEDERERTAKENLRRAQNDPPLNEIWSGDALNILLRNVQRMTSGGKADQKNIPLDEDLINKININSGKAGINFGLLKNEGKLSWPLALRDLQPAAETRELRDQLQALTKAAFEKAKEGQVDPGTIREMDATVDKLEKLLKKSVGDMPFAQYSEGKRYLTQLNDGLKALREPNAADFANGKFKLKGNTVGDLLDYMTKNGLQFAPAVTGEESAYVALHRAMVNYNQSAPAPVAAAER